MKELSVDILIVGAGPAGLSAALEASKYDINVLVVEKNPRFAMKPCGEAVSRATLDDLGLKPSRKFIRNDIHRAIVYAPNLKDYVEIKEQGAGYIIDKEEMLKEIASLVSRNGGSIWIQSPVVDFTWKKGQVNEVIVLRKGERVRILPKIVIACDGISSKFSWKLFDHKGYELIPTIQYIYRGMVVEDEHTIMFYVGNKIAPRGYLWVFPRGNDEVGVGIGTRGAPARPFLEKFIYKNKDLFSKAVEVGYGASAVPVGGQLKERVKGNLMICGDAAGQVIPLTGGGIHSCGIAGKIAGRIAAEAIINDKVSQDFLKRYEVEYDRYWGLRIKQSLKALKAIENLTDNELNELAKLLTGEDIINLANGIDIIKVAKKLMKHPIMATKIALRLLS
ncbi:MAG: NAD(P)/FAD-dependent oxidoreductase [Thermoprotei archaeon]|nr:NAD(P)/FAD-dependent oxidoreductase [Thermoprotei archaeon]